MSPGAGRRGPARRCGASLLETLVALLVGLLLLHLVLRIVGAASAAVEVGATRSDRLTTVRMARWRAAADAWAAGPEGLRAGGDSLALRAVRGGLVGCGLGDGVWSALAEGARHPDPDKDSVQLLQPGGAWSVHALEALVPPGADCSSGSGGRPVGLVLDPPPSAPPVAGRYFERGSYHLADGALRWRRGDGGRQPLTPEVLERSRAGDVGMEAGAVWLRFRPVPARRAGAGGTAAGRMWRVPAPRGRSDGG